jgi:hypothetical protein
MNRFPAAAVMLALSFSASAEALRAREITFFSNQGFSGARFTVTSQRNILRLPFTPRSARLRGVGGWQLCSGQNFLGPCQTITQDQRNLLLRLRSVQSIRPVATTAGMTGWRDIARLPVRDRVQSDIITIRDNRLFRQAKLCAERNTVRLRSADLQRGNGTWQRLNPLRAIQPGRCSSPVDLGRGGQSIRAVRFDFDTWMQGASGAIVVVRALPQ